MTPCRLVDVYHHYESHIASVCLGWGEDWRIILYGSACNYRGADKSLARPGRKQARKHVRDARDFNNIETRAAIKCFFPPARQGAEGNSRHSDRNTRHLSHPQSDAASCSVETDLLKLLQRLWYNLLRTLRTWPQSFFVIHRGCVVCEVGTAIPSLHRAAVSAVIVLCTAQAERTFQILSASHFEKANQKAHMQFPCYCLLHILAARCCCMRQHSKMASGKWKVGFWCL